MNHKSTLTVSQIQKGFLTLCFEQHGFSHMYAKLKEVFSSSYALMWNAVALYFIQDEYNVCRCMPSEINCLSVVYSFFCLFRVEEIISSHY